MIQIPTPGKPVRGSASGAPIMALFDLMGRRWAMGVLWVLSEQGPLTFRQLQTSCETISPGVLNQRLKELRAAGFVERGDGGYAVSAFGWHLYHHLRPLEDVSKAWAVRLAGDE